MQFANCLFPHFPPVSFKQNTCPNGQVFFLDTLLFFTGKSSDIPDLLPVDDPSDQIRDNLDVQQLGNGAVKAAALLSSIRRNEHTHRIAMLKLIPPRVPKAIIVILIRIPASCNSFTFLTPQYALE